MTAQIEDSESNNRCRASQAVGDPDHLPALRLRPLGRRGGACPECGADLSAPGGVHRGMPIANPRFSGGNQPTTSRPLAVLLLAADIPPRNNRTPSDRADMSGVPPPPFVPLSSTDRYGYGDGRVLDASTHTVASEPHLATEVSARLVVGSAHIIPQNHEVCMPAVQPLRGKTLETNSNGQ